MRQLRFNFVVVETLGLLAFSSSPKKSVFFDFEPQALRTKVKKTIKNRPSLFFIINTLKIRFLILKVSVYKRPVYKR